MPDLLEEAKRLSERKPFATEQQFADLARARELLAELAERVEQLTGAVIEYETRLGIPPFASIVDREALAAQQREVEGG